MTQNRIFVGADSRAIVDKQTSHGVKEEYNSVCKIEHEGAFNFAVAGEMPEFIYPILHDYCSKINTINLIDSIFVRQVDDVINNIIYQVKKENISYYRSIFIKQNHEINTAILIWGFENDKPYTKLIEFIYTNPAKDSVIIKNKVVNNNAFWAIGLADEIYNINQQQRRKIIQTNIVKAINYFISIEIKAHHNEVGAPISILCSDNKGSRWIQGGACY